MSDLVTRRIDKAMLYEAIMGVASEGILQGYNNAAKGDAIDNDAIRERVNEVLSLIASELTCIQLMETAGEVAGELLDASQFKK